MTRIIGKGRYASEVYPISPGVGAGSGGDVLPFSNLRYLDPATTHAAPHTGSVSNPCVTVAEIAALTPGFMVIQVAGSPLDNPAVIPAGTLCGITGMPEFGFFFPSMTLESGANVSMRDVYFVNVGEQEGGGAAQLNVVFAIDPRSASFTNQIRQINLTNSQVSLTRCNVYSSISATFLTLYQCRISSLGGEPAPSITMNNGGFLSAEDTLFTSSVPSTITLDTGGGQFINCTFNSAVTINNATGIATFDQVSLDSLNAAGGTVTTPENLALAPAQLMVPMIGTQTVAASEVLTIGANYSAVNQYGSKATAFIPQAAAVGESLVITLVIATGAVIGSVTIDNTTPPGAVDIPLITPKVPIPPAGVLLADLNYTSGVGPTPLAATVVRVDLI
jgi:hypothetical protein